jgi:thiamine-monophosphate kinase
LRATFAKTVLLRNRIKEQAQLLPHKKTSLDEEETVELIWKTLSHGRRAKNSWTHDPYSDDVSWFPNQKKQRFVISKADMLVADTDTPPQMNPSQIGSKAIVAPLSDFAAKGVKPSFCLISIAIPKKKATYSFIRSLAQGFAAAGKTYRVKILAGDTSGSRNAFIIDVTVVGFANAIVKRGGALPGQIVGVSGPFGHQSSGLAMLLGKARSADKNFRTKAERSVLEPKARLDLGLRIAKYLTSCIDSSDGLALSLYHLAESSRVDLRLDSLPTAKGVERFATLNKLNPNDLVLFGGEEYELVMTFKPEHTALLQRLGVIPIGKTALVEDPLHPRVFFKSREIPRKGWIHNQ